MTVTAPTATMDTTGWCRDCRGHSHKLCEEPDCRCALGSHPKRRHVTEAPEDPLADVRARATTPAAEVCGSCRRSQHTLCTKPACGCLFERHPNRRAPDTATRAPATGNGTAPAKPTPPKLREPVWGLVRADPPPPRPKPKKLTAVERARPLVEQLMAEENREWHRFAVFPSSMSAGQTKGRVAKAYREFEFLAVRVPDISQSALYGRWTGEKPRGLL